MPSRSSAAAAANNQNNCTGESKAGRVLRPGVRALGGFPLGRAQPDPEQLYLNPGPEQKAPAARGHRGEFSKGGGKRMTPIQPRCQARPRSNPDPDAPSSSPMTPNPNNSTGTGPESPMVAAPSPRTGCFMGISGLFAIFRYILWVMLNNPYIWCYVHHTGLSQTLKVCQFVRNILLCVGCNLLLYNVLLVNE